jgi:hypothetical protein
MSGKSKAPIRIVGVRAELGIARLHPGNRRADPDATDSGTWCGATRYDFLRHDNPFPKIFGIT